MFLLAPSPEPNRVMIHTYGTHAEMDHSVYYRSRFDLALHYVGFLLNLNCKNLFWVLTERQKMLCNANASDANGEKRR